MKNNEINNTLHRMQTLLEQAKKYFKPEQEKTFFDVGLRGHYENPTTELLEFYLNPNNCHGLDQAFFSGLIKAANIDIKEIGRFESIEREYSLDGGRIDLLLAGETGLIIIECKIHHHQNNPFKEYKQHIESNFSIKKHKHFIVLSIDGSCQEEDWRGLSYDELIHATKPYIGEKLVDNQLNKWAVLALELIAHLGNLKEDIMDQEQFTFIQDNLQDIRKLAAMENAFYNSIYDKIKERLGTQSITMKISTWPGDIKVLRFYMHDWQKKNECIIHIQPENHPNVKIYACINVDGSNPKLTTTFKDNLAKILPDDLLTKEEHEVCEKTDWWWGSWEETMDLNEAINRTAIILELLNKIDS